MRLLRAELHRFRSRRFIVLLVLLGLAVFVTVVSIASTNFAKPSAAGLAKARQAVQEQVAQQNAFRKECLANIQPGQTAEVCPPPADASQFNVADFMQKRSFVLAKDGPSGASGVAGGVSALLFVIGATWIGAEWSSKTMTALLFWEPRRVRVLATKLGVLVAAAAVVAALGQALWFGAARLLASTRGVEGGLPSGFYGDLLAHEARGVLLGVLIACLGFALSNLVRNTGAALGIGFVYFAIVENAIRALRPRWQSGLLTNNAAALLNDDGNRFFVEDHFIDKHGLAQNVREVVLGNLHGALVLSAAALVLLAVGGVLFSRRDLQ